MSDAVSRTADHGNGGVAGQTRVLVRDAITESGLALLRQHFRVDVDGESDLAQTIGDYDAIVVRSKTKLTATLIAHAHRLKVIGRAGVGLDNVDVEAARRHGILVANTPDASTVSVAEHTMGLLIALARSIPQADAALRRAEWNRSQWLGIELAGKTLGLLGFGRIGQQVARRARAFEMRVVAFDPAVPARRFRLLGVRRAQSPEEVYAVADFLTLHLPLTPATRKLIDRAAIAQMKDGVRILNTARGRLIDESALIEALQSGKVAGAALDVFDPEPYSGPLRELKNVVLTPHIAGSTRESQDRTGLMIAAQTIAALAGRRAADDGDGGALAPCRYDSAGAATPPGADCV